jgi:methylenetetrahydrofolate dehydrogenase (NADP+)/methenyltetrahydrofolate cyclohydrolase
VSGQILDGKAIAASLTEGLVPRIRALPRPPGLTVVLVGSDPASTVYVRNKSRTAERLGMAGRQVSLPEDTPEAELLALVADLNADPTVDGILVQLPLPRHIDRLRVLDAIDPAKDVDGFHPENAGRLFQGRARFVPCTPAGVMVLLGHAGLSLRGRTALVVGRSNIVGRPMVALLEQADCTVTAAHSRTADLAREVGRAAVLVAAVGALEIVRGEWIRPDAVVIDVGMNRRPDGKLGGDVEFAAALPRASWITPVPGGVGPMTIAMLMSNTVTSAERRLGG